MVAWTRASSITMWQPKGGYCRWILGTLARPEPESALQGTDIEAIKNATQDLNATMQKIGQAVYQQQQPPPGGQEPPPPPPGGEGGEGGDGGKDEGTVEGEFREV